MTPPPLSLPEQVLLLAMRDQQGTPETGTWHGYAIGGAILAELLLAERLDVEPTKRALVNVFDSSPIGAPALDACLEQISGAKRRAAAQTWVGRFAVKRDLWHMLARGLCAKGILQEDEATVLLFFKRAIYPEINPVPERDLVERLREAIFTDSTNVDPETAILVSIAYSAELLKIHFDKKDLRKRKARLEQLSSGEMVSDATRKAVQAAQAAIVAACIIPAVVVTS